jgi:hypothetical protein
MDKYEEDDILSPEEQSKIDSLRQPIINPFINPAIAFGLAGGLAAGLLGAVSQPIAEYKFGRRWGLDPVVKVNNISGKKAWIILTPAPIMSISSIGIDKLGQIAFTTTGDYKCQQSGLSNNSIRDFELDNSQVYYTVFFDCDGKWKTPFKDRKINTRKYDINLLERHVEDAIEIELVPIN